MIERKIERERKIQCNLNITTSATSRGHHANSETLKTYLKIKLQVKLIKIALKNNLTKFTSQDIETLTGNSFFREFVPFSYCPWKERKFATSMI